MTAIVVDASACGPLIIPDESSDLIPGLIEALLDGGGLAPQHWRLEVASLARTAVRRKRLPAEDFDGVMNILRNLSIEIDTETMVHAWSRTLVLSMRHDLTVYDAAYIELATRRGLPLATLDQEMVRAAEREQLKVVGR